MTTPDYTLVIGVDAKHLRQLEMVWPTWKRHKPSLLQHPMIVFRDTFQVSEGQVKAVVDHPNLEVIPWPSPGVVYSGDDSDKWNNRQRHKMLAGFVHVPALYVKTPYWLKLDTDVVATGQDDWINPEWFVDRPAIVAHPWSFTKPADQMIRLHDWVMGDGFLRILMGIDFPSHLVPKPGAERLGHRRIISWCGFFRSTFTARYSSLANRVCGPYQLPVPSQDGFMWFCADRAGLGIRRTSMKTRGWAHWSTEYNVREAARKAMENVYHINEEFR